MAVAGLLTYVCFATAAAPNAGTIGEEEESTWWGKFASRCATWRLCLLVPAKVDDALACDYLLRLCSGCGVVVERVVWESVDGVMVWWEKIFESRERERESLSPSSLLCVKERVRVRTMYL